MQSVGRGSASRRLDGFLTSNPHALGPCMATELYIYNDHNATVVMSSVQIVHLDAYDKVNRLTVASRVRQMQNIMYYYQ